MPSTPLSRRHLIQRAGALGSVALAGSLLGTRAQAATALETKAAKLGFIALTDAAPLFVADEKGFFKKHGMTEVEVLKQSSWGTTRDNLVLGSAKGGIDGGHILTPMPYLITTGAVTPNNVPVPMNILARLNLGGQGISVGAEYADLKVGTDTKAFGKALAAKRGSGIGIARRRLEAERAAEARGGRHGEAGRMDEGEQFEQVESADFGIAEPLADQWRVQQDVGRFRRPGDGLAARRLARLAAGFGDPDAGMGCMASRKGQRSGHSRRLWCFRNKRATSFGR